MCPKWFFLRCFSRTVFPLVFSFVLLRMHVEISIDISIRATEIQLVSLPSNPVNRRQWAEPPPKASSDSV